MTTHRTDFSDCLAELIEPGGPKARQVYEDWLRHPERAAVHDFVKGFRHEYLFEIRREEVTDVVRRTEHALGNIEKRENVPAVRDFDTPFAHQYLFHEYLERFRHVPTWQEFKAWLIGEGAPFYIHPFQTHFGLDIERQNRSARDLGLWRALRWRLGILYYSAIRELDLFAALREEYGLPLKYHIFADVVLRSDFWCRDVVVCLYISNGFFRAASRGRKLHIDRVFRAGGSALRVVERELPAEKRFGEVWLVSDARMAALAEAVRAAMEGAPPTSA